MAYVLKRIGTVPNIPYRHFECDNIDDLPTIDLYLAPLGSTCYVINAGATYKLNSNKEWVLVPSSGSDSGGGDSGGGGVPDPAISYVWDGGEI